MVEVLHVDDITENAPLSGRVAHPDGDPLGLIIALHGGSYSSAYYDLGGGAHSSALRNYASLGYRVVAPDRPGYGRTAGGPAAASAFDAQADVLAQVVDDARRQYGPNLPVYLVGHSVGGMIALLVAERSPELTGVMVSGMGVAWRPGILEMWTSLVGDQEAVGVPNEARDQIMFWGPIDPAVHDAARADLHPVPTEELKGAITWHERMPVVGPTIRVPVLHVLAEGDGIWASDEAAQQGAVAALKGSARPVLAVQRLAGHCVDAHLVARAHHLQTAAFFEESRLDG